jgi:hypothetical protein
MSDQGLDTQDLLHHNDIGRELTISIMQTKHKLLALNGRGDISPPVGYRGRLTVHDKLDRSDSRCTSKVSDYQRDHPAGQACQRYNAGAR